MSMSMPSRILVLARCLALLALFSALVNACTPPNEPVSGPVAELPANGVGDAVKGADDPAFRSALGAWLADDDRTAYPALAALAREGNPAAQLLLGRAATRPTGPWLATLTRNDRNALLRAPGGLSGTSWLNVAADRGDDRARLFLESADPRADTETMTALAEAGEGLSAAHLALNILNRTGTYPGSAAVALWRDGLFPSTQATHFAGTALATNALTTAETARLQAETAFPDNEIIAAGVADGAVGTEAWLRVAAAWHRAARARDDRVEYMARGAYGAPTPPELLVVRKVCDTACGAGTQAAMLCYAGGVSIAPPPGVMFRLASPVEAIISTSDFAQTGRARREWRQAAGPDTVFAAALARFGSSLPACVRQAYGLD